MRRVKIAITGYVQGVGFRQFICWKARHLKLCGRVKNVSNGSVEAILEGENAAIQKMLELCKQGPDLSSVDNIHIVENQNIQKCNFDDFEIDHTL